MCVSVSVLRSYICEYVCHCIGLLFVNVCLCQCMSLLSVNMCVSSVSVHGSSVCECVSVHHCMGLLSLNVCVSVSALVCCL